MQAADGSGRVLFQRADGFYSQQIGPRTGRVASQNREASGRQVAGDQSFGITSSHAPSILDDAADAALRPGVRNRIDIGNPAVAKFLQDGHVSVSGVSGSTNILTYMYDFAASQGLKIAPKEFAQGVSSFVVKDGGHSFKEALWVINNAVGKRLAMPTSGVNAESYVQFRAIAAHDPAVAKAFDDAWSDLAKYLTAAKQTK